ncbi:MAG: hypothetical protein RLZZ628_139 [Bacteroidota bacterium]|jgi:hypothetical protein
MYIFFTLPCNFFFEKFKKALPLRAENEKASFLNKKFKNLQ